MALVHSIRACQTAGPERSLSWALLLLSLWLLFHSLGSAALLEPDEGRHAEAAREMLVLNDWITPHYNFVPRLEKPPLFHWLAAFAYELFGVSEASARLPSALAAFGVALLTGAFSWSTSPPGGARWSVLVLLTCVETLALARTAIPDMLLTFFITFALCSFFWANQAERKWRRNAFYLTMYGAMGAAVLTKGLIGFVLPGLVITAYLVVGRRWSLVREMKLATGLALFLAVAAPWYWLAEIRNPGYIEYFLWEEHLLRFLTPHFGRTQPWYYFVVVGVVGFLPWSVILPWAAAEWVRQDRDDQTAYLWLWVFVPLLFFSLSNAKLPHYILPIFPPLSILTGRFLAQLSGARSRSRLFALPWLVFLLPLLGLAVGFSYPAILTASLQRPLARVSEIVSSAPVVSGLFVSLIAWLLITFVGMRDDRRYLVFCAAFALFSFFCVEPLRTQISLRRSSKELAAKSASVVHPGDWVALYEAQLTSLPFYLQTQGPLRIVQAEGKEKVMGSFYAARRLQEAPDPDPIVVHYGEFSDLWRTAGRRLLVFVPEKQLYRFLRNTQDGAVEIVKAGDVLLVGNPEANGGTEEK